jgi:hypothetical protein
MMKSWGDDYSSDEDSRYGDEADDEAEVLTSTTTATATNTNTEDDVGGEGGGGGGTFNEEKNYEYPDHPPYTAFVGNLSFRIKDEQQLQQAIVDAAFQRLNEKIDVIGGRISYDRVDPNKHRGFGYVEVETLDQVREDGMTTCIGLMIRVAIDLDVGGESLVEF